MSASLPMENGLRRDTVPRVAHSAPAAAKSLRHNAFSIQCGENAHGDGSLSALSYALRPRRTQPVVVEGVTTGRWTHFNAISDSQITNFNILVAREIGIASLRMSILGERHG